jgi:hypothetical protein
MTLPKPRTFRAFIATATLISSAAPAQGAQQWIDLLTQDKICAANWTWKETTSGSWETVTKNCEKRTVTVLDKNLPPIRSVAPGVSEVLIGTGTAKVEAKDLQEARRRAIELVVAEYVKQNLDKNIYKEPTVANPSYLDSSYSHYGQLVGNQKVPDDAILPPKGIAKEGWSCSNGVVGITGLGRPFEPRDCKAKIVIDVEVYGQYHPITYTLPTKQIQEKVDPSCQETENNYIPGKTEIGMSDVFMSLADVSAETYTSIKGNSLQGAAKSKFECPHGIHYDEVKFQAIHAMDWLRKQPQPLDVNNDSVAATIRYLKALALEKSEQLNSDLIRSILKLHKDYPQLAFGGQETLDTAVETAVDDIEANRRKWQDLEKKLDGTQGGDTELGARLLVKLSGDKISKIDNFMTVSAYSEQSDLVISSSRRFSTEVFRINVTSGTITKQSMPYMQPTTTTVVTKTESAYKDLVQHLLSLASDLRALNATGEELYQYFSGLVPAVQSELDKIKTQLINHVGSELTFRAAASAENYSPVSFRVVTPRSNFSMQGKSASSET